MGRRGRKNLDNETMFFVTTTVVDHTPVFRHNRFINIIIEVIKFYQKKYEFKILSYVIMPTHFHWILNIEPKNGSISDIMRDIKKSSAYQIIELISKDNFGKFELIFRNAALEVKGQERKIWMKRFDDEVIRNEEMFWTKVNYIHNNPVKAGLAEKPEDYLYSSAQNYISSDNSILYVDTGFAGIHFR